MIKKIVKFIKEFKFHKDPTKYCDVFRKEGCCHVDGFLCFVDTCLTLKEYKEKNDRKL